MSDEATAGHRASLVRVEAVARVLKAEAELGAAEEDLLKRAGWNMDVAENGKFGYAMELPSGGQWTTVRKTRAEALALELSWTTAREALTTP